MQAAAGGQQGDVTALLLRLRSGDRAALDQLVELIYPELRLIARACFRREAHEHILQPTALVNEAYQRLIAHREHNWRNRAHFFGAASHLMRRILIERAKARMAQKRSAEIVPFDEGFEPHQTRSVQLLRLEEALVDLAKISPRQARVVEMRYFGGLTEEEAAEALDITPRTVSHDWAVARAFLRRYLEQ